MPKLPDPENQALAPAHAPRGRSTKPVSLKSVSRPIAKLLARLRRRVRWLVLLEGIATAIIWAVLLFWLALALDYLPVKMGLNELSREVRLVILLLSGLAIAYVLYRLVFRRIFVRLKDQSMAMLVERTYPQFNDSLLTTVSRCGRSSSEIPVDESMLDRTRVIAEEHLRQVEPAKVVSSKPMRRSGLIAGLLLLTVAGFAFTNPSAIKLAGQRLYWLGNDPWPRSCQIEIVGIHVKRDNVISGIDELARDSEGSDLRDGKFHVAKGAALALHVRAVTDETTSNLTLPEHCTLIYQIHDGDRGFGKFKKIEFKKIGGPRDGIQRFMLDGQPLQGILSNISFEVRGGDHRVGPFEICVVDEPTVLSTELVCKYPGYLVDEFRGESQTTNGPAKHACRKAPR